jgi:hypothetical protein
MTGRDASTGSPGSRVPDALLHASAVFLELAARGDSHMASTPQA